MKPLHKLAALIDALIELPNQIAIVVELAESCRMEHIYRMADALAENKIKLERESQKNAN